MRRRSTLAAMVAVVAALLLSHTSTTQATPAEQSVATAPTQATAPAVQALVSSPATAVVQAEAQAAAAYDINRCGNTSGYIILSFDDWAYGQPYRMTWISGYLKSRGIRAMFFVVWKDFAERYPNIVAQTRKDGHWVLNHTATHAKLTTLSSAGIRAEIRGGTPGTNMLRPPFGAYNSNVLSIATSLGYRSCMWTIDSGDTYRSGGKYRSVDSIRANIRNAPASAKANGMILCHLHTNCPAAMGGIISDLQALNLKFCNNRGPMGYWVASPPNCR